MFCFHTYRHNHIAILPDLPDGLEILSAEQAGLRSLPLTLPSSLEVLCLRDNSLGQTGIPELLDCTKLRELDVRNARLRGSLPDHLPPSLEFLDVHGNMLSSLPEPLPPGLLVLSAGSNQLLSLPALPSTLTHLRCAKNSLSDVELSGCESLRVLNLANNELVSLDFSACVNLEEVDVSRNRLESISDFQHIPLLSLCVDYNRLAALPPLPPTLERLAACTNRLDEFPESLPTHLNHLNLSENAFTVIPEDLPDWIDV